MREWNSFTDKKPEKEGVDIKVRKGKSQWTVKYKPETHDQNELLMWTAAAEKPLINNSGDTLAEAHYPQADMGHIGARIKIIRKSYLNRTQVEMRKDLNTYYNDPTLFSQPRLFQIENLASRGTKTFLYINYLCSRGFNANWILTPDNMDLPAKSANIKGIEPGRAGDLKRELNRIKKFTSVLKISIDEFNDNIDNRILTY